MTNVPSPIDTTTPAEREAIARAQEAASRVPDADLIPIRVDITDAALGVIGQLPAIESRRAQIVAVFGADGEQAIDALAPAARALMHANAALSAHGPEDLEPAAAILRTRRTRLQNLANALVERGVVKRNSLSGLEGGSGYVALVHDTEMLVAWFRAHAAAIAPYSKVTPAELDAIESESGEFGSAWKEKVRSTGAELGMQRARAFTYFVQSYELVRKFVAYARWHEEDADVIAPSLYAGRTRSKDGEPTLTLAPTIPNDIPPGMPGSNPFINT